MALVLVLVLLLLRVPLHVVMLIVPLVSAFAYGGLDFALTIVVWTSMNITTWSLVLSLAVISWLVSLYNGTGVVKRLCLELSNAFKSYTATITLTPGIIGLLPVPGGALMSAPIVDELGSRMNLSKVKRLFANVWYRHIIVYIYPLSSVIILASAVTGISLWDLVLRQIPIAIAMFLIGLPVVGFNGGRANGNVRLNVLIRDIAPIVLAIVIAILLSPLDKILGIEKISVSFAVIASITLFTVLEGISLGKLLGSLRDRRIWELVVVSFGIMMFRELFTHMDLRPIMSLLISHGISGLALTIMLPIFFSTVSGHPAAGIAIATPLITSIMKMNVSIASLIYASAFIGYIASPLHLCYVYTAQYYKVSLAEGYKYMIPATVTSLIIATIVSLTF